MISSTLVDAIKGAGTTPADPSKLFVFAGFCLIAAVSSRSFITSISERILNEAKQTQKELKQIKKEVAPIIAKETETEPQENENLPTSANQRILNEVSEAEKKILLALANGTYTLRTRTGISTNTEIPKNEVNSILEELMKKGLAKNVKMLVRGEPKTRWYITPFGRSFLERK
jgi:sugar-specific transcriptional regulator TrmB